MRLLTKTTLYFLTAMTVLLVVAGYILFLRFSRELDARSDKELLQEEGAWITYLQSEAAEGVTFSLRTPEISIFPVDAPANDFARITDATVGAVSMPYRQLSQVVSINGVSYQFTIRKSQEQKAALVASTAKILLLIFIVLLIATLLFNWLISRNLWNPFYRTLQHMRQANLQSMQGTQFEETSTREFTELNVALNAMTKKIHRDFVNMKEFTENAAHEMQTPLSVIKSKLELLLQNERLSEDDVKLILDATTASQRLSKLNQGLLLLAKIENDQYKASEVLSLKLVTEKYLGLFTELIQNKKLTVSTHFEADFFVSMHPLLADSLISNLLENTIRYNYEGGSIAIIINAKSYKLSNSSLLPPISTEKLFKRFAGTAGTEEFSNGLGLAIVKKIVDTHGLAIQYASKDGITSFEITPV